MSETNEEKARVLSNKGILGVYIRTDLGVLATEESKNRLSIYGACMEAMEWKDKELKNYLDELLAKLNACEKDRTREATIVEIIKGHFFKNVDLI
ncbi:MAG: hypothetical protein J6T22_09325 [Bacteroidales bacterium]|nr:hypothetical protein [Bacteroidales bacterium]MBO7617394.1 hypothetical protein [Bacteroidales bacterium]